VASIEYGIDGNGRKIYADEAVGGRTYKCHHCGGKIHVRKCYDRNDYFAHENIPHRTPQQMICPGYTGPGKNKDSEDELYIVNGGVPLHLIERTEQKFELIALFPPLSQECRDRLIKWDVQVEITGDGTKEIYSAANLRRYRVRNVNKWIYIKCINMQEKIVEVKKKWEWGIRGLDFENDLFMSDFGGGCRVAQHSNIVIGKEYLLVNKSQKMQDVVGINFKKKGNLTISNMSLKREYEVVSFVVTKATNEAIAFIQIKGFQLIEKNDEIIPLWPPAIIEGKELIYKKGDDEAILYHEKHSNQRIYSLDRVNPVNISEKDNLIMVQTNNKLLIISDYMFNSLSKEIKIILTQDRENYNAIKSFEPNMRWKFENGTEEIIGETFPERIRQESVSVIANSRVSVIISRKNYVERSSNGFIGRIKRGQTLFLDNLPFELIVLSEWVEKKDINNFKTKVTVDECVDKLYHCQSTNVTVGKRLDYWIAKTQDISIDLYKILLYWKSIGEMPCMAETILKEFEEELDGYNY